MVLFLIFMEFVDILRSIVIFVIIVVVCGVSLGCWVISVVLILIGCYFFLVSKVIVVCSRM